MSISVISGAMILLLGTNFVPLLILAYLREMLGLQLHLFRVPVCLVPADDAIGLSYWLGFESHFSTQKLQT